MIWVRSRYFHLAFKRKFSDLPFPRSSRHKITTFDAYVEKVRKLDGIRVSLDYVMRCEARISTNRLFGKRRIIISVNEYEIYLVLEYFRSIGICFSRNQCVQKRYISISCSKSNRKSKSDISTFVTKRTLSTHINWFLVNAVD